MKEELDKKIEEYSIDDVELIRVVKHCVNELSLNDPEQLEGVIEIANESVNGWFRSEQFNWRQRGDVVANVREFVVKV